MVSENKVKDGDNIVVWFSCGAASAIAAYLTILKYGHRCNIVIANNFIKEEDKDNYRFLLDVQKWLKKEFVIVSNKYYPNCSCVEVWDKRKYMSGVSGAPCTMLLKKHARQQYEDENKVDWHVLGFTHEESGRHARFVLTERENVLPVLIEEGITKEDCFEIIQHYNIELPLMYKMLYPNANCPGCVKSSSPEYWNHVRKMHPLVFKERAEQSRRIGCKLVKYKGKRIFLDELDEKAKGKPLKSLKMPDCGIFCEEKQTKN